MEKLLINRKINSERCENKGLIKTFKRHKWYYILLIPGITYFLIFMYFPMFGLIIAFKDYRITSGIAGFFTSRGVGLDHFKALFTSTYFLRALRNTVLINLYKLIFSFPVPIILALMLNEVRSYTLKKVIQTSLYIPYFISWAVIGGIVYALLSPEYGALRAITDGLGLPKINILMSNDHFRPLLVVSEIWKDSGLATIIYLATLASIDPCLYEAAVIDGAGRFRRMWNISLAGMSQIIFLLFLLKLGNSLNQGTDQVLAMYNPIVYEVSEILTTYIFKTGIVSQRFSYTTAAGLFNSVVGFILIVSSNYFKKKITGKAIW